MFKVLNNKLLLHLFLQTKTKGLSEEPVSAIIHLVIHAVCVK